jgi:ABC-type Zn2+ transport system substrate-binding protein/surface adhesin
MKTKPMYLFMNLLFQKMIEKTPKDPTPTQGDFVPREEPFWLDDRDHDHDGHGHEHEHEHDHHHEHAHSHGD